MKTSDVSFFHMCTKCGEPTIARAFSRNVNWIRKAFRWRKIRYRLYRHALMRMCAVLLHIVIEVLTIIIENVLTLYLSYFILLGTLGTYQALTGVYVIDVNGETFQVIRYVSKLI